MFGFIEKLMLCSYVPKKGKAFPLGLLHDTSISEGEERKPSLFLDYNSMKGAVDTIDITTNTYARTVVIVKRTSTPQNFHKHVERGMLE